MIEDILKLRFEKNPNKAFLNIGDENITYKKLHELAEEIAGSVDIKKHHNKPAR